MTGTAERKGALDSKTFLSESMSLRLLLALIVGVALQAICAHARVRKEGRVCTVIPEGHDDSPSIISAFAQCKKDASVVFLNETYHVERVMSTHGLRNVTVDIKGTLLVCLAYVLMRCSGILTTRSEQWGTDTTYWINNSLPLGYQNQSVAWDFGGDDIFWTGHGYGTFNGNGQIWWALRLHSSIRSLAS